MKRTAIAVFLGLLHAASPNYDKDVESVDTIIKALYEVISEKGEERIGIDFAIFFMNLVP